MTEESDSYGGSVFAGMNTAFARHPQPAYKQMRSSPVQRVAGLNGVIVSTRAGIDEVLRHPEIYSSSMHQGRLGNVRPLIPIEIDPPDQRKFRKILDPLFAPKRLTYL